MAAKLEKGPPSKKGKGKFSIKLPAIQLPAMPGVDPSLLLAGALIAFITIGSAMVAIEYLMPTRIVYREGQPDPQPMIKGPGIAASVVTPFNPKALYPAIATTAFIHPQATVIGNVTVGDGVYIGPQASVQGTGDGVYLGSGSSVMDGSVIQGLPTMQGGQEQAGNTVNGKGKAYAIYLGKNVLLAPQSQLSGPAILGDNVFLAMGALVDRSQIGHGTILDPHAAAIGVTIAPDREVPAGNTITSQAQANALPVREPSSPYLAMAASLRAQNAAQVRAYLAQALGPKPTPSPSPEIIQMPADSGN